MSPPKPKLRGSGPARNEPYPLGEFFDDIEVSISKQMVHRLAVGQANISGDDFGQIFANGIGGEHRLKPLGITDVTWEDCSWSCKTVQATYPFKQPVVRLISGRNSPDYSYNISDPREDVHATGTAVLNIWNHRVNQSLHDYEDLRVVVLMRNMDTLEFTLFEYEAGRYSPGDYYWTINPRGNFEGSRHTDDEHCFTWQPHGSQFTVLKHVPGSAIKFRINRHPGLLEPEHVLQLVRFSPDWVVRVQ